MRGSRSLGMGTDIVDSTPSLADPLSATAGPLGEVSL
jgi:hypothetical protein